MKKALIFLLVFGFAKIATPQFNKNGYPFYRYFSMDEYGGTEQNWAIVQDNRGMLYVGNNDKGVVQYDGVSWRQISVPSIVRSLACDKNGIIYVGAVGDFGNLIPGENGNLHFRSLRSKLDTSFHEFSHIWKTYATDSSVFFCETNHIFQYNYDTVVSLQLPDYTNFSFYVDNQIYSGNYVDALLQVNSDSNIVSIGKSHLARKNIFMLDRWSDSNYLLGTLDNGLYLFNKDTKEVQPASNDAVNTFLQKNRLYHGVTFPPRSAFATLNGGIVTNYNSPNQELYDHSSGLPNDETVLFLYSRNGSGTPLWAALNNGIVRFEWNSPFRVFDERNDLIGSVSSVKRFKEDLYVATSSGLFILENSQPHISFRMLKEQQVWDLFTFKQTKNRDSTLLIGTNSGLYQLQNRTILQPIEDHVKGILEGTKYTSYHLTQNPANLNELFIGTSSGFVVLTWTGYAWEETKNFDLKKEVRSIGFIDQDTYLLGTTFSGVGVWNRQNDTVTYLGIDKGIGSLNSNYLFHVDDDIFLGNVSGLYKLHPEKLAFANAGQLSKVLDDKPSGVLRMAKDRNQFYFAVAEKDRFRISRTDLDGRFKSIDTALFNRLPNVQVDVIYPEKDVVWFGCSEGLFTYNKNAENVTNRDFNCYIRRVTIENDSVLFGGTYYQDGHMGSVQTAGNIINIKYRNNEITFQYAAPFFEKEDETVYSYKLDGYDENWSKWEKRTQKEYTNLSEGRYTFKVKAKNIYGKITKEAQYAITGEYDFRILPPWYRSVLAYLAYFIIAVFIVRFIVRWRTRKLEQEKEQLEEIVKQRTAEIVEKKEEIERQRDEIAEKSQSITDSIHYASRIQQALLPSEKMIQETLPEHFVLFKPRDIVSGDYYWLTQIESKTIVVAADCTGHGVPGAFMSMLGMSFLNEIVNKNMVIDAGEILNNLRAHVIEALKQQGEDVIAKDGMDLALYVIDQETDQLQFAGANNPLYIIRTQTDDEKVAIEKDELNKLPKRAVFDDTHILEEVKADPMPIGIHIRKQPFHTKLVNLRKGMQLYTFSDGFVDQFGGPKRRKFMSKRFKKLLMEIREKSMAEQYDILDKTILDWIEEGGEIQVDDIIVFGVKYE